MDAGRERIKKHDVGHALVRQAWLENALIALEDMHTTTYHSPSSSFISPPPPSLPRQHTRATKRITIRIFNPPTISKKPMPELAMSIIDWDCSRSNAWRVSFIVELSNRLGLGGGDSQRDSLSSKQKKNSADGDDGWKHWVRMV